MGERRREREGKLTSHISPKSKEGIPISIETWSCIWRIWWILTFVKKLENFSWDPVSCLPVCLQSSETPSNRLIHQHSNTLGREEGEMEMFTGCTTDWTDSMKFSKPDWNARPRLVDVSQELFHSLLPPFYPCVRKRLFGRSMRYSILSTKES